MKDRKLKILYFTGDQTHYVKENWEYFKSELSKLPNVRVAYVSKSGPIDEIMKEIGFTPDFIFFDDMKQTKSLVITGLDNIGIPKGVLAVDLHGNPGFGQFVTNNKIDLIFSIYRDAFYRFYPEFVKKLVWFPHHVYTPIFKYYGLDRRIDYLLMGAVSKAHYPLRATIAREMAGVKGFVRHNHPGYQYFSSKDRNTALIGKRYAKEINRAKVFFTDSCVHDYPIAKYYEVTACKTLLLASGSQELRDLGFIHKETFVQIDVKDYYEKARYYLKRKDKRREIADRGYRMTRAHHTTEIRVRQFVACIRRYLGWDRKLDQHSKAPMWVRLYEETSLGL
ncbi:glycosyltransferase [Paenibacillus mendelii]|uniref:Glycosyltransferase n=1 Tax=Paenibacillus mendelii TaxID=206163 RepID=A0ABV6J945_9BACL|nr:glycosyltransferase [Paenibacillus mendelii]MCQ6559714.1 glycosyltransferase [Paenibacillus mendelii]